MKPCKFLIITNHDKDPEQRLTKKIAQYLASMGCELSIYEPGMEIPQTDMAVALGGDGSMLAYARLLAGKNIPILGINLGHVGFLTAGEREEAQDLLSRVLRGDYLAEERMMLRGTISRPGQPDRSFLALNDAVIGRADTLRMTRLEVKVNHQLFETIRADGMIVSTPTGSTAYNLSAGGPIVVPSSRSLIVTPICPNSLFLRSLVISDTDTLQYRVLEDPERIGQESYVLMADGQETYPVTTEDTISIQAMPHGVCLIRMKDHTFFDTLKSKLFNE